MSAEEKARVLKILCARFEKEDAVEIAGSASWKEIFGFGRPHLEELKALGRESPIRFTVTADWLTGMPADKPPPDASGRIVLCRYLGE